MRDLLLLVDDEPTVLGSLYKILKRDGYDVLTASNGEDALRLLELENVSVCLLDLRMPGMDGLELLGRARARFSDVEYIIMSGHGSVEAAVAALHQGAADFISKPFQRTALLESIEKAIAKRRRSMEGQQLRQQLSDTAQIADILGQSAPMREVLRLVQQVGPSSATVLIEGESGTGKELIASAIQQHSRRRDEPYVRVNCAAIPDSLMESELFGHEKGAFTGAVKAKKGRFELADCGTIFLDEIGDMSPSTQMKVLRVLQEGEIDRVGGTRTRRVDVRVIAATNVDLERAVRERRFREDLFYRLRVIQVKLPPLRERKEDVALLAEHFMCKYANKDGKKISGIDKAALAAMIEHNWPGNVRELENAMERAVVLMRGEMLMVDELPPEVLQREPLNRINFSVGTSLQEIERRMIAETLRYTDGDKTKAARILGITSRTIYRKLERRRRELDQLSDQTGEGDVESAAAAPEETTPEPRSSEVPLPRHGEADWLEATPTLRPSRD